MASKRQRKKNILKELSNSESLIQVKKLLTTRRNMSRRDFIPGNLIFTSYDAKDKKQTYDKTPLILILRRSTKYTLGLNFHWLPMNMRLTLIKLIISQNKLNIKNNKPMKFSYHDLRPHLKSLGYAPVIRLYINKRMSKIGVVIPPDRLIEVARLKTETFTNGRYSAQEMLNMARKTRR